MKKISKKKRKTKSSNKAVYFAVAIAVAVSALLFSVDYIKKEKSEVSVKNLDFEDTGSGVYVKFDIDNPTDEQKACSLNLKVADKQYIDQVNISAKSKKAHKMLVDMPGGKTNVKVYCKCS